MLTQPEIESRASDFLQAAVSRPRDYSGLPESLREGTRRYIEDRVPLCSFLTAVASNDLSAAVLRADPENAKKLAQIVWWWLDRAPGVCWGSEAVVREWTKRREVRDG